MVYRTYHRYGVVTLKVQLQGAKGLCRTSLGPKYRLARASVSTTPLLRTSALRNPLQRTTTISSRTASPLFMTASSLRSSRLSASRSHNGSTHKAQKRLTYQSNLSDQVDPTNRFTAGGPLKPITRRGTTSIIYNDFYYCGRWAIPPSILPRPRFFPRPSAPWCGTARTSYLFRVNYVVLGGGKLDKWCAHPIPSPRPEFIEGSDVRAKYDPMAVP